MTKWARMRRRKQRRREEATKGAEYKEKVELTEPAKISDNVNHYQQTQKNDTSNPSTILSHIPRYVYLIAIFALLSGVFFPLVSLSLGDSTVFTSSSFVIGGMTVLFLGLFGCILLFKGVTSDNKRKIFLAVGFVSIAISLGFIFQLQVWWREAMHF